MKKFIWLYYLILVVLGCGKTPDSPVPEVEPWVPVYLDISEPILDARVNGDQLHLITDNFFYRISGETVLEKRPLSYDHYRNYFAPVLGQHLIFRLLNHDSIAYLEFQPILPGGSAKLVSYDDLGNDTLTFPITHAFGARHTGQFDDKGNFLFVGLEYPSFKQFARLLKIEYAAASNSIQNIQIDSMLDLNLAGTTFRAEDVFESDGILFINAGVGGVFRYSNIGLEYFPNVLLNDVIEHDDDFYSVDQSRTIIKSADKGINWVTTPWKLKDGRRLLKEGDFYIETTEVNQLFSAGASIEDLKPIAFPPYNDLPFTFAEIIYYNGVYLLYGNIDGKNQVFKRSTLE